MELDQALFLMFSSLLMIGFLDLSVDFLMDINKKKSGN
jgi:hypothetical protein